MSAATAGRATPGHPGRTRLPLYRNPLRLAVSASTWHAAWYLIGYLFVTGWVLFSVAVTASLTAAGLAITLAGIPLMVAAGRLVHGCAAAERRRLGLVFTGPVHTKYRQATKPGLIAQVRAVWRDRATWRELGYLGGLWIPLFILDALVFTVWAAFLAGITLPAWYWAPRGNAGLGYARGHLVHGVVLGYFPHGATGRGSIGVYVDTLPKALLVAAIFLVLFLLFSYVLVLTARVHARVARSLLRPPTDPLAEAKEVLDRPGPLGSLDSMTVNGR